MEATTNDSSTACGQSALTDGLGVATRDEHPFGAFRLHKADAKTDDMLMWVVGHSIDGLVGTVYYHHRDWKDEADEHGIWWNRPDALLDPANFGITTPNVVGEGTAAASCGRSPRP